MSQALRQGPIGTDFPTAFGDTSNVELLKELKERLAEQDDVVVFRRSYSWFYTSLETCYADEHFRVFQESGELPHCVKVLLLKFLTDPKFSI